MNSQAIIDQIKKSTQQSGPQLSVGTLTGDLMDHQSTVQTLEQAEVGLLHIDVMDGRIWPKITVGPFFVAGLKTKALKDVHLLVEQPERQIESFAAAGADLISFSVESCGDVGACLDILTGCKNANDDGRGVLRGLSVYPGTSLDVIQPHLEKTDYVTLVSIGPNTGKENFLADMPARVEQLRQWKQDLFICITHVP